MARTTDFNIALDDTVAQISCVWTINDNKHDETTKTFRSVNMILGAKAKNDEPPMDSSTQRAPKSFFGHFSRSIQDGASCNSDKSFAAIDFFLWCCSAAMKKRDGREVALKLVLPRTDGYIVRSNFLEQRMADCEGVERVENFCQPLQYFRSQTAEQDRWNSLFQVLANAAGGILLNDSPHGCAVSALNKLEAELSNRLSFAWTMAQPIARKTLALVDGRDRGITEPILQAAKALGIGMFVLDRPGHWLESTEFAYLRERFVPIDMTNDRGLPTRIFEALSSLKVQIDGLTNFYDFYVYAVAEVANFLALPCESLNAFEICGDKYRQRVLTGDPTLKVSKWQDPESFLDGVTEFPMVVKPSKGVNSEGVSKVHDPGELETAVHRLFNSQYDHFANVDTVAVEAYCGGPELDVNFVLGNGEILFVEFVDDFPKAGDQGQGGTSAVFKETAMVSPSGLPVAELEMLKSSLHRILLDLGFRSGVYHVEARVRNSSMQYHVSDGVLDLRKVPDMLHAEDPSTFLIEVNPRPPGVMSNSATISTHGIDYLALHLLFAVGDRERVLALSQPFASGPQYWSEIVFISTPKGGVFCSDDIGEDLKRRCPDLAYHVSSYFCCFEKGQRVPEPTADNLPWIAWFVVFSRVSRRNLLETAEKVRAEVQYELR